MQFIINNSAQVDLWPRGWTSKEMYYIYIVYLCTYICIYIFIASFIENPKNQFPEMIDS